MSRYFLFFVLIVSLNAQTVFEPMGNRVYSFLERMNLKGYITLNDETRPFPRRMIAEKLAEIKIVEGRLNSVERDELEWFSKEFYPELTSLAVIMTDPPGFSSVYPSFKAPENDRIRLLSYRDSLFSFNLCHAGDMK